MTTLENGTFISRGLTELEELHIILCKIKTIELGAFNGLAMLTSLIMAANRLSEITSHTFEELRSLKYLDLHVNRIGHLEVDAFFGLDNLKLIDLQGNYIQYLHPDLFVELHNLETLLLSSNFALTLPTDRHFISSDSLTHLSIDDCSIRSVSVQTFANVTALEWLDLSINKLRTIDINMLKALPKLSALYLRGNPLQCDCQLQEVWRWCQDHNIQTAYWEMEPECDTPSEVQGIWWGVLEKGQCLEGNISYYGDYKHTSYTYTRVDDTDTSECVSDFLEHYEVLAYAFPIIFGITGNIILIIIIICNKEMRTVPNMYILNMAISDMIYLMVLFSEACANFISDTWLKGNFVCKFFPFCRRLSVGLSAYSVVVLSFQRYRVTVDPFHIRVSSQPTWCGTVATICGMWTLAVLFAIPSALSGDICYKYYLDKRKIYYETVVVFELCVSCLLPLCVIAFSYIMTARHLVESSGSVAEEGNIPQMSTRKYTAKIVLALTIVFLISYVPYHAFWTYVISTYGNHIAVGTDISLKNYKLRISYSEILTDTKVCKLQYTYLVSTCLLLINSCFNPVALCCTSLAFRKQFKRYLTCCCKPNFSETDIELTKRY
jgi:hypothetical protein